MQDTQRISETIGQRHIAEALGVGTTAVSNAVVRGIFPPSWFVVIKRLCSERGIECPEAAFNFKGQDVPPPATHGAIDEDDQGAAA